MSLLNKSGGNRGFLPWFGFVMVLVYFAFGLFILSNQYLSEEATDNAYKTGLGWLLIGYGFIRSYRVYKDFKSTDDFSE